MAIVLMRLLYGIYFIGVWVCIYHMFSRLFYDNKRFMEVVSLEVLLLTFFWPLALFSKAGRERLKGFSKEF